MSDVDPGQIRVGDAEREEALRALGEHLSAGRLNIEEYGERTAKVAATKTRGELLALFVDLPSPRPDLNASPHGPAATAPTRPETDHVERNVPEARGRRRERPPAERALGALIPLSFIVAMVLLVVLKFWFVLLLPVAIVAISGGALGRARHSRWRHGHRRWR